MISALVNYYSCAKMSQEREMEKKTVSEMEFVENVTWIETVVDSPR